MATVLGILGTDSGHHPAAALIVDGRLVAFAEEERFTRAKNAVVPFPIRATAWCLSEGGVGPGAIDRVAYGWGCDRYAVEMPLRLAMDHLRYRQARRPVPGFAPAGSGDGWLRAARWVAVHRPGWVRGRIEAGLRACGLGGAAPPVTFHDHHRCHAATAFWRSGFTEAAVLVMDGSGEDVATTAWRAEGLAIQRRWAVELPHSLGWFYAALTEYLGFVPTQHEGKTMGLAAYGQPGNRFVADLAQVLPIEGGEVRFEPRFGKYGHRSRGEHFADALVQLLGPPRSPDEPLISRHHDIAWAAQDRLESAAMVLARRALRSASSRNLCLAGGVAMNCKMNGRLTSMVEVDGLFVQPASDDAGAALGAAMLAAVELGDDPRAPMAVDTGPSFDDAEIEAVLRECHLPFERPADLPDAVAERLADGDVVGWFQGRMECGARALGRRSILANPADPTMRDRVNQRVKLREPWRPYCPSLTRRSAERVLGADVDRPFMIVADEVSPEVAAALPSVVHVDGTVRAQTVDPIEQPAYHAVVEGLGRRTGWEVVLNTSFNVRGEPIVCTPRDALRTWAATGMDAVALGPFLVDKRR